VPWLVAALAAAALLLVPTASGSVLGHGELILQLGSERIQPGGTLGIRGDLGVGEQFQVALISARDGSRRVLGVIPAVDEGHFDTNMVIPADVAAGDYLVEAGVDALAMRAPLTIAGPAIVGEGGEGPDRADPLSPVGSVPAANVSSGSSTTPSSAGRGTPLEGVGAVVLAGLGGLVLLGALRVWTGRRRAAGDEPG
jgi:hypothetical protein